MKFGVRVVMPALAWIARRVAERIATQAAARRAKRPPPVKREEERP